MSDVEQILNIVVLMVAMFRALLLIKCNDKEDIWEALWFMCLSIIIGMVIF